MAIEIDTASELKELLKLHDDQMVLREEMRQIQFKEMQEMLDRDLRALIYGNESNNYGL